MNSMKDKVIGAAIGLAKTCNNHPKTPDTTKALIEALSVTASMSSEVELQNALEMLHKEKYNLSPDCAVCANPCGNTDDYDMRWLRMMTEENVKAVKEEIIEGLLKLSRELSKTPENISENQEKMIYRALEVISYDLKIEVLQKVIDDMKLIICKNGYE